MFAAGPVNPRQCVSMCNMRVPPPSNHKMDDIMTAVVAMLIVARLVPTIVMSMARRCKFANSCPK